MADAAAADHEDHGDDRPGDRLEPTVSMGMVIVGRPATSFATSTTMEANTSPAK